MTATALAVERTPEYAPRAGVATLASAAKGRAGGQRRPRVLIVVGHFSPGFKAGGILRSVLNIIDHLHDRFEFLVLTRDRDFGDTAPYPDVATGAWVTVGNASVRYLAEHEASLHGVRAAVESASYDLVYLNSFFEPLCIAMLANLRLGRVPRRPIVLAPRGEFAWPSLRIKYPKKLAFMLGTRLIGFFRAVTWHAANDGEAEEIRGALKVTPRSIVIAGDLPTWRRDEERPRDSEYAADDALRVVFLSRIAPEKNLEFALRVLRNVTREVRFDIVGPLDHPEYWERCRRLIGELPANVVARHVGSVQPHEVMPTLSRYDLMFFPSGAESYGHVIAEAFAAGLPVLISTGTPWRGLEAHGIGWDVSLDDPSRFVERIDALASLSPRERAERRDAARDAARAMLAPEAAREAHANLFLSALHAEPLSATGSAI